MFVWASNGQAEIAGNTWVWRRGCPVPGRGHRRKVKLGQPDSQAHMGHPGKQWLQGAATSYFLPGFTDKLLLLALPVTSVGICKGSSCPQIPLYVREWQCLYHLPTLCSPPARCTWHTGMCIATHVQTPNKSRWQFSSALLQCTRDNSQQQIPLSSNCMHLL